MVNTNKYQNGMSEETIQFLWTKKFPNECKKLPYKYLDEYEQYIVDKCITEEEMTEEEKSDLQKLLQEYRPYFNKEEYDINKIKENIDNNLKIVNTENQLLSIINDPNRYRLDYVHRDGLGGEHLLQFQINPITDKQHIDTLGTQLHIIGDLSEDEKKVLAKKETNMQMTRAEEKMFQQIHDMMTEKITDYSFNLKIIDEFLADRLELLKGSLKSFDEKVEFWEQMPVDMRVNLFMEVRGRLNMSDSFREDLFPAPR